MTQHEEVTMSRRRLLKLIAATGGAVAASGLVPAQWITPVVNVGTLPVLAQEVSPWVDLELRTVDVQNDCEGAAELFLDYYDPTGGITEDTQICLSLQEICQDNGATLEYEMTQCFTLGEYLGECGDCWEGDATEGSIYLHTVCLGEDCEIPPECDVTILIWLDGSNVVELPCQLIMDGAVSFISNKLQSMRTEAE